MAPRGVSKVWKATGPGTRRSLIWTKYSGLGFSRP